MDLHRSDLGSQITGTFKALRDTFPVGIHMFEVNNRNSRIWCKTCSKLTIKTPERRSHLVLLLLLLTLNM